MKKRIPTAVIALALLGSSAATVQGAAANRFPAPATVSPQLRELVDSPPSASWKQFPRNALEWKAAARRSMDVAARGLPALSEGVGVTVTRSAMAGVPVFTVEPKTMPAGNAGLVLLNFHGGGYVMGKGEAGTTEAIFTAGMTGYRVIVPDYRMPPDHPYPAAMDDAISVYRELLKTTPAGRIGVFGTSAGGGMALALVLRARTEGLPLPAAVAAGTPWTDMTKTGDSYLTNEHVDNVLVSYDGWLAEAAKLYANGHDLKDPMLSPVYGDVKGFPPALLICGTRDLFLSNTVRMHLKLREADVNADLLVFEGASHCQYSALPDAPETRLYFRELARFFGRHLK